MIRFLSSMARRVLHHGEQRNAALHDTAPPAADRSESAPPPITACHAYSGAVAVDGVRADLRVARWDGDTMIIEGWATVDGRRRATPRALAVWALPLDGQGQDRIADDSIDAPQAPSALQLTTTAAPHLNPNGFVTSEHDLSTATFSASLTSDAWDRLGASDLQIAVQFGTPDALTPLTHRYRWGSAGHLFAHVSDGRRYAPRWHQAHGLCVRRSSPAAFTRGMPVRNDNSLTIPLSLAKGFHPVRADWTEEDAPCAVSLTLSRAADAEAELVVAVTNPPLPECAWGIVLTDEHGARRLLHWGDAAWDAIELDEHSAVERPRTPRGRHSPHSVG